MQLETFRGKELRPLVAWLHRSLGDEALVVRTNLIRRPEGDIYEVLAARPDQIEAYQRSLSDGPVSARIARRKSRRPYVIALVGPPGAGKTTAVVKLALHPLGVGARSVGLITLDTFRVGGAEALQTYAEIAGLPLEVVYHEREVPAALRRLGPVQAVIVDTPGRPTDESGWLDALAQLEPDEVHVVVPASMRPEIARRLRDGLSEAKPTHALITKLDEVPADVGLAAMADAMDLPVRWVGEGHDVPGELAPAASRIIRSLGKRYDSSRTVLHVV